MNELIMRYLQSYEKLRSYFLKFSTIINVFRMVFATFAINKEHKMVPSCPLYNFRHCINQKSNIKLNMPNKTSYFESKHTTYLMKAQQLLASGDQFVKLGAAAFV